MPRFSRGGTFLRFSWIEANIPRTHVISVKGGTVVVGGNNTLVPRDQTPQPVQDAVNFYMQQVDFAFGSGFASAGWELYTQADEDALPVLIQAGAYNDPQPLQPGSSSASGLTVFTLSYRSVTNGRGRLVFSGSSYAPNQRFAPVPPPGVTDYNFLFNYLMGASCIVVAPDGGYPLALRGATSKINDQLLKRVRP